MSEAKNVLELARSGSFDEAISGLARLRKELGSARFVTSISRAIAALWPASPEGPVALFEAAALASDDPAAAVYNLGTGLWAVDETRAALAAFEVGSDRGSKESKLALGISALWVGSDARGLESLNSLVGSNDQVGALAAAALGRYQVQTDQVTPTTVELLARGVTVDDDYVPELAEAYLKLDRQDDAINLLTEQSAAGNPVAPIVLGNIYEDLVGDDELAEKAFRRGVELNDAYSAYNLAALLDKGGRVSESRRALKLAARMGDERAVRRLESYDANAR